MDAMATPLARERKVFDARVNEWVSDRMGQWVLIKEGEVIGFFDSLEKASAEGLNRFGLEDFFIQQVRPPDQVNVTFLGQRF
jgi:hypothetical protein